MWVNCDRSVIFSGYSCFLHQLNKTDRHKIAEILLIVVLNTITLLHSDVVRFYREQERLYILMYKWYTWKIADVSLNNKSLIHHIECFVLWLRKYFWKKKMNMNHLIIILWCEKFFVLFFVFKQFFFSIYMINLWTVWKTCCWGIGN